LAPRATSVWPGRAWASRLRRQRTRRRWTASEPRGSGHDDRHPLQHGYLRLGIVEHEGDMADVVLDRRQVAHLVKRWQEWLEAPFIDDGFPS